MAVLQDRFTGGVADLSGIVTVKEFKRCASLLERIYSPEIK